MIKKLLFFLLFFFGNFSHANESSQNTTSIHFPGVEKSWEYADVYIPGSIFLKRTSKLKLDKKYPVVLYMHGCIGINSQHDLRWGRLLSGLGFVVVLPDSLSRPGRVSNCDPRNFVASGSFPQALAYREHEISYAMDQLKKSDWADISNIFLMGHSEGANAVARTNVQGFRGYILSSGRCTSGINFEQGVKALIINFSDDPWHRAEKSKCQIERNDGSITLLYLQGADHLTFDNSKAREAVENFLKQNLKQ